jgi:hypothetical protein
MGLGLILLVTGCSTGGEAKPKSDASAVFTAYVLEKSTQISDSWDTSVQPLLETADPSSEEWKSDFISALTVFSIVTASTYDGVPLDVGKLGAESEKFKLALTGLTQGSTGAWMAVQNDDVADLGNSMDLIKISFEELTAVVSTIGEARG